MLWSSECLIISSCSLLKAASPSPYSMYMWISNTPRRQYAMSSERVVTRVAAHDILWAIVYCGIVDLSFKAPMWILVMSAIQLDIPFLSPRTVQSAAKKNTFEGARSSCNVQPRVNHRLFDNLEKSWLSRIMLEWFGSVGFGLRKPNPRLTGALDVWRPRTSTSAK